MGWLTAKWLNYPIGLNRPLPAGFTRLFRVIESNLAYHSGIELVSLYDDFLNFHFSFVGGQVRFDVLVLRCS